METTTAPSTTHPGRQNGIVADGITIGQPHQVTDGTSRGPAAQLRRVAVRSFVALTRARRRRITPSRLSIEQLKPGGQLRVRLGLRAHQALRSCTAMGRTTSSMLSSRRSAACDGHGDSRLNSRLHTTPVTSPRPVERPRGNARSRSGGTSFLQPCEMSRG